MNLAAGKSQGSFRQTQGSWVPENYDFSLQRPASAQGYTEQADGTLDRIFCQNYSLICIWHFRLSLRRKTLIALYYYGIKNPEQYTIAAQLDHDDA